MKKFLILVFLSLILIILPHQAKAANEFSTNYDISYLVNEDGSTDVTENIRLKNLTDKFFPSSFSINLPGTEISGIEASDLQGKLDIAVATESANTKVTVNFSNQQIIGLNKEYAWVLKFKDRGIASSLGKVWNINLPKISQQTQVENLSLSLLVPSSFGDPDYISPQPDKVSESGGRISFAFTKNELLNTGISAIFGSSINFEFENSFILSNHSIFPKYENLAIPGNSMYQKVYITGIEPRPENTTRDALGNTLAIFKINPGKEYEVKVKGNITTFLKSQYKDILSQKETETYLAESKYWDNNNPAIKNKLSEILQGKEGASNFEKARLIDKYVASFLQFDSDRIMKNDFARFGSVTALNNPEKALSAEFVDLESALLRAAGIPTRQVIGFALKGGVSKPFAYANQNLHTWLEFYDPNQNWVIADPAWESTTRGADFFAFNDLNHLALAYSNGQDNFRLPGYVDSKVFDGELKEEKGADLDIQLSKQILSGFPSSAKIRINNLGNLAFPSTSLQIDTSKILLEFPGEQPVNSKSITTPEIPPFGNLEYDLNLKTGAIWHSYQDAFQVKFAGVDDTRVINVIPILSYQIFAIEIFGALTIIILFYIVVLLVHRKQKLPEADKPAKKH